MASGPPGGDAETQATDAGIASDDTVQQDSSQPTPAHHSTGPKIRISNNSLGPDQLGRYMIVKPLGRGGMGAVYEAEDPELGRRVAIKVLRDDRHDAHFTEGLRREAQALAKLVHPHVVTVYDVGFDAGRVFVVMQLIDGESIDRWLRERKARPVQIVSAFRSAGRGLAAAHAAGLVHCDFKPGNVLVDREGAVRVSDFGLARIGAEEEGTIAGTPAYMAPEQFTGVATAASDQYSFCVALCEVLLGKRPFPESKIHEIEAARARPLPQFPRAAGVPAYVVRALHRGLSREPHDRFPSMDALLAALAPPAWRRWALASGAAVIVLGGTVLATSALSSPSVAQRTVLPDAALAGVPDLGAAHALTRYGTDACAYSPAIAGDHVVFDRTQQDAVDLYELPLAGGTPRQLTSAPTWEWRSNPGRRAGEVVHLVHDPKDVTASSIMYLDVATGQETLAAHVAASDSGVTVKGIVYVPQKGVELRRIDGQNDVVLARSPAGRSYNALAVSHRGDKIALFAHKGRDSQLCVVDVVTSTQDCFAPPRALPYRPAFGADDRFLYYAAVDGIHRLEVSTRADALIIADVKPEGGIAVSADGRALVYSDCGTRSKIVDWSTRPPTLLVDDPSAIWPSGITTKQLAWVRAVRGVNVLVVRDKNGHETQLTEPEFGPVTTPAMSPDGTHIAFRAGAPHVGLYTMPIGAGSEPQRISDNPSDITPVWAGTGMVAFTRQDDRGMMTSYVVQPDGAMLQRVSPNTRFVLGGRKDRLLVSTLSGLYWFDFARETESPGPSLEGMHVTSPVASPDGNWLLMRSGPEGQHIMRRSLDPPGKLEDLGSLPSGETLASASITNDGHVLLAPLTWSGDLHVVPAQPGSRF